MALNFSDVINRQADLSFVPPQNFFMTIERLPQVVYTVQQINIPNVSINEAVQSNPLNPGRIFTPGDSIDYAQLDITFLIDKQFKGYRSILEWGKGIVNAMEYGEAQDFLKGVQNDGRPLEQRQVSPITVFGTDNDNVPIIEWKFFDCFPISVDGPQYDATPQAVEYLTSSASFRYNYFECTTYTAGAKNNDTI